MLAMPKYLSLPNCSTLILVRVVHEFIPLEDGGAVLEDLLDGAAVRVVFVAQHVHEGCCRPVHTEVRTK